MKKSGNSDKLFPLHKHPTDALPVPNGAVLGFGGAALNKHFSQVS